MVVARPKHVLQIQMCRYFYKYTSSHFPGLMFIFALCFLNEPFIQSRTILPSFIVESSSLTTIKENIHPWTIHGIHAILDFLRHHLQESFPVQFGDHLWYWDHLRAGIICGAVQITLELNCVVALLKLFDGV